MPRLSVLMLLAFACGCSNWGSMDHPAVPKAQGDRFEPPAGTVPVQGSEPPLSRDDADRVLSNPVPPTDSSLVDGEKRFNTFCVPCHGKDAKGQGPVAPKFIPPPDLTQDFYRGRSDGYIYGTIRNGGAIMPAFGERLTPTQRWDVVNYLRKLQGK